MALQYYVIDTETSGLDSKHLHEICEISIIRCSDRFQLSKTIKCETPQTASFDALRITGKTMADLELGEVKESVVESCNKFFEQDGLTSAHRVIVAHNAAFDSRFLKKLWEKCNTRFPADMFVCTMQMCRAYLKAMGDKKPKVSLDAVLDKFALKKYAAHTAKGDSRSTYLLWKELVENIKFDYLPFIKNEPHMIGGEDNEALDPDLLD